MQHSNYCNQQQAAATNTLAKVDVAFRYACPTRFQASLFGFYAFKATLVVNNLFFRSCFWSLLPPLVSSTPLQRYRFLIPHFRYVHPFPLHKKLNFKTTTLTAERLLTLKLSRFFFSWTHKAIGTAHSHNLSVGFEDIY